MSEKLFNSSLKFDMQQKHIKEIFQVCPPHLPTTRSYPHLGSTISLHVNTIG
jgi:hypothetical protein